MPADPPLFLRRLRKSYGDVVAVDGLDLEVRAGECFGLLGPNGAGKTTTIEICEGLTEPDDGRFGPQGPDAGRFGSRARASHRRSRPDRCPDGLSGRVSVRSRAARGA